MKRSIFKLLCILYLTFVIMAEPPEKKFKIEAVEKAHRIIRNSAVVPIITPAVVLAPPVAPIVAIVVPPVFPPVIAADSASVGLRAGYYQTANGQWKKKPTPRSTVTSGIVSPAPRSSAAQIPVAISPASNSSIAGGATSAIISPAAIGSFCCSNSSCAIGYCSSSGRTIC